MKNHRVIVAQLGPEFKPQGQFEPSEAEQQTLIETCENFADRGRSPGRSVRQCDRCGGTLAKTGAGRKPGEESQSCLDCGQFLGYQPITQLKQLRRRKKLTDCLNLLESCGLLSQEAQLLVLSEIGTCAKDGES